MKKTDFFMRENKLVQEALIQMKNVEEAIAENAKGILASTMKEEINQLVKESLSEQDEDEIELDVDADTDVDAETDNEDEMEMDLDMDVDGDEDEMEMDIDMDSMESPIDLTDASDEEILKVFKAMGEEDGIIIKKDGDDVHLTDNDADVEYLVKLGESEDDMMSDDMMEDDMMKMDDDADTDAVIDAIFAEMENMDEEEEEEEEEEEIVYEISLEDDSEMMEDDSEMMEEDEDSDEEEFANESYNPKKGMKKVKPTGVGIGSGPKFSYKKTSGGFKEDKKEGPKEMGTGKAKFEYKKGANMEGKSKVVKTETKEGDYGMNKGDKSKTMKGKEDYTTKKGMTNSKGEKAFEKEETKEAARTYGMGSKEGRGLRKGITNNRNYVYKNGVTVESLDAEVNMLREKNEEYRKALNVFREKLNEVAIFNSNLAYATRLFTEHSTTKKEKINILRRFDDVETLKESKSLYRSIKEELGTTDTKSINESVGNKLNKTVTTGSSTTLIESKTYENPQFLRMKDLMGKLG
jgi:hypothetical protein